MSTSATGQQQPIYNLKSTAWLNRLFQQKGVDSAVTHEEKSLVGECLCMSYMEQEPKMVISQTFECEPFPQIQDHIRSGAGDTVNVQNLRPPEVLDKTMHYLVHAHMRNPRDPHWYTLSMQQFNYIGDRFRRIRTQWAPQFMTTTVKSKEECATPEQEKYAYDSNRRKRWLEFMARTLLAYNGLCTRSPELCAEHLLQKQQILEALKDTFGTLIHYYRLEQRYRSSEMVSIVVLFYGLHQLKKVESCDNWCRFDENTGEFEHPMKGVDLKEVYAELAYFPHVAMTSHVQDALELMHAIQQRQWFHFFTLCRTKPLTFGQKCCLTHSFTYVRFRAIVDLCTVSQTIGKQPRARGSVPIADLVEGLMFDSEEHCLQFLEGLGLQEQIRPKMVDNVEVLSLLLTSDKNEFLTNATLLNRNAGGRGQDMPRIGIYFPPCRSFLGLDECVVQDLVGTPLKFPTDESAVFTDDIALTTTPINVMKYLEPHCPSYNERVASVPLMPLQYPGRQEDVSEEYFNEIVVMRRRTLNGEENDDEVKADEEFNESESDEAATASLYSGVDGGNVNQSAFEFLVSSTSSGVAGTSTLKSAIQDTLAKGEEDALGEDKEQEEEDVEGDADEAAKAKAAKVVDAAIDKMMDDHKAVMSTLTCNDIYESYFKEQRDAKMAKEQKTIIAAEELKRSGLVKEELPARLKLLQQMKSDGEVVALKMERMKKLKEMEEEKAAKRKEEVAKTTTAAAPKAPQKETTASPSIRVVEQTEKKQHSGDHASPKSVESEDIFHKLPDEFPPTPPETPEVVVIPAPKESAPKLALALPPKPATLPPHEYPKIEPLSPSVTPTSVVKPASSAPAVVPVATNKVPVVAPIVAKLPPKPVAPQPSTTTSSKTETPLSPPASRVTPKTADVVLAPPTATPKRDETMLPPEKHTIPQPVKDSERADGTCVSPRRGAEKQKQTYRELLRAAADIAHKEKKAKRAAVGTPTEVAKSVITCQTQQLTSINWWSLADELLTQFFERQRIISECGLTDDITATLFSLSGKTDVPTQGSSSSIRPKTLNNHCFSVTDSTVENVRESGTIELLSLPTVSFYMLVVGEFGSSSFGHQRGITTQSSSIAIGTVLRDQHMFPNQNDGVASGDVLQSKHRQHFASDNGARPAFNAHIASYSMDHEDVKAASLMAVKTSEDDTVQKKASAVVVLVAENVAGGYERALRSLETLLSDEATSPAYVAGLVIAAEDTEMAKSLEATALKLWSARNREAAVGAKRLGDPAREESRLRSRSRFEGRKSFFARDSDILGSEASTKQRIVVQHTPPIISVLPLDELYTKGINMSGALTESLKLVMVKSGECALEMTTPQGVADGSRGVF